MIEIQGLTKRYKEALAIDNLSLTLRERGLYCLLGRNGAGKTTLMKLLAGRIPATRGRIRINGKKVTTLDMPEDVQYIEAARPQFNMRVDELIDMAAALDARFDKAFANQMARRFGLEQAKRYNRLSFGMKTMATTLLSLSSNKRVVLLDEPVLGFDALMREQFYALLAESYARHPRLIVVSTHLIDEIAKIAERIVMIEQGKLLLEEDITDFEQKAYKVIGPRDEVARATQGKRVLGVEDTGRYRAAYVYDSRIQDAGGLEVTGLALQEAFIKLAGGQEHA